MIGKTLTHYRVVEQIGEGGMGSVYLAEDLHLNRKVALKLLHGEMASKTDRLERFKREAKAVAALNHPNIVTIFSIEEAPEGHFITMEHVEGKGLDEMVTGDGVSIERLLEIAQPLIKALVAAHGRGITHRDLKPANIMVTPEGTVKILDFGLAKLQASSESDDYDELPTQALTQVGAVVGTIPYMSPEQVQGRWVDHRTDIFSLGVILYEMATGKRPFGGESSADVASSILRDSPSAIHGARPDVPKELGRIIDRCLEKEPEMRYQTAADIQVAFSKIGEVVEEKKRDQQPSVAVLPFVDLSPEKDQDYFCDGLAEELINSLAGIEGLQVASRTSAFRFKSAESDIREIGRRLDVTTVLEGSVRKSGNQVRIGVQLVNVEDGYHLWSNRYDRQLEDVFAIQDEIAQKIVEALQVTLTQKPGQQSAKAAPADVEAYDYYLKGRKYFYEFRAKSFDLAREMFAQAIAIDNNYARAYAGVADSCSILYMLFDPRPEILQEAESASQKAVEIGPNDAEAHASRGLALSLAGKYEESDAEFEEAIRLNPKLYEARYFYARALFASGRHEAAAKEFEAAGEINPDDYQAWFFLAQTYNALGRRAFAAAAQRKVAQLVKKHISFNPEDSRALLLGASSLIDMGELDLGQQWLEKALEIDPDDSLALYNAACTYAQLGKVEEAIDCLEKSSLSSLGTEAQNWMKHDPDLDPLREHPRFKVLLGKES